MGYWGLCRSGFTIALHWFNHLDWCICAAAYERKKGSPHRGASLLIIYNKVVIVLVANYN